MLIKMMKITKILHRCYKNITKMLQFFYKSGIIYMYKGFCEVIKMKGIGILIYILIFIIVALIGYAVVQIKAFGMNVKDFWSFIEANQTLDRLYEFSKRYEKLSVQEQLIYLKEAEEIFNAFDKVPNALWEDEYEKYNTVLEKYKDIKMLRWANN